MAYSILIVDDHILLRKGIKSVLDKMQEIGTVVEAQNGFEAIEEARKQNFDLVLLDISMPEKDGIDTLNQLKYEFPKLKVMMLSMLPVKSYAIRALKAGASGYLEKDCHPQELTRAVKAVISKGKYISHTVALELASAIDVTSSTSALHDALSDREFQVLRLLAEANTINEIAGQLNISAKTVTTYKARALQKLKLKNTAELVRYFIDYNL